MQKYKSQPRQGYAGQAKFKNKYKNQNSFENILLMLGKALWTLVSLLFRKRKSGEIVEKWKEVQELMQKNDAHAWAMAIMKADRILDKVLEKRVSGETLGERLKNMEGRISRDILQSAWDGHKVRNQIAHGDSEISRIQAQDAIANFRKVLNEIKEL